MSLQSPMIDHAILHGEENETEWAIVPLDWWRTPFSLVSWSYADTSRPQTTNVYAKPPYYHGLLLSHATRSDLVQNQLAATDDLALNSSLSGVADAEEIVTSYEADVGFYYAAEGHDMSSWSERDLSREVDPHEVMANTQRWQNMAREMVEGVVRSRRENDDDVLSGIKSSESLSPTCSGSLHRSTPTLSSIDLTDSDNSANSMPSTPKAKGSYASIAIDNQSPDSYSTSPPSRRLNAAASSFVPNVTSNKNSSNDSFIPNSSSKSSSLSTPGNFTFPSLNPSHSLPVTLKKDEQGFYTEVQVPESCSNTSQRPSSALLPPFLSDPLHRRKQSRTRAIVDRLRSSVQESDKSKRVTHTSIPPFPTFSNTDSDLFRPRLSTSCGGDSPLSTPSAAEFDDGYDTDGWITAGMLESDDRVSRNESTDGVHSTRPSSVKSLQTSVSLIECDSVRDDVDTEHGWIKGSSNTVDRQPSPSPCHRLVYPPVPLAAPPYAPVGYPSYPHMPYAAAAYMQFQMQMQRQMMHPRGGSFLAYPPYPPLPAPAFGIYAAAGPGYVQVPVQVGGGSPPW